MLSVETKFDVLIYVDLVNDLICIVLQCGCEDNDFVILGHQLYKLYASGPHEEEAILAVFDVVDERFIKIEHQSINRFLLLGAQSRQEWRMHFWQISEIIWEHCFLSGGYRRCLEETEWILACQGGTSTSGADEVVSSRGFVSIFDHLFGHGRTLIFALYLARPTTLGARCRITSGA